MTIIEQAIKLADFCGCEKNHYHRVTDLSLKLFDQLIGLHRLEPKERSLLELSAVLHDIGWKKGQTRHHKTARDMVLRSKMLKIPQRQKIIVALLCRYHRKALPKGSHKYYAKLKPPDKLIVEKLSALLRIADGLDRSRTELVKDFSCRIEKEKVILKADAYAHEDKATAQEKSDLFEKIFKRRFIVE